MDIFQDRKVSKYIDFQTDKLMEEWMDGQISRQPHGQTDRHNFFF